MDPEALRKHHEEIQTERMGLDAVMYYDLCASRYGGFPTLFDNYFGFRLVLSLVDSGFCSGEM